MASDEKYLDGPYGTIPNSVLTRDPKLKSMVKFTTDDQGDARYEITPIPCLASSANVNVISGGEGHFSERERRVGA